jgi:hypothetical protein
MAGYALLCCGVLGASTCARPRFAEPATTPGCAVLSLNPIRSQNKKKRTFGEEGSFLLAPGTGFEPAT